MAGGGGGQRDWFEDPRKFVAGPCIRVGETRRGLVRETQLAGFGSKVEQSALQRRAALTRLARQAWHTPEAVRWLRTVRRCVGVGFGLDRFVVSHFDRHQVVVSYAHYRRTPKDLLSGLFHTDSLVCNPVDALSVQGTIERGAHVATLSP
ncbi:hypothetical protein L1887_58196 [Cichorium endivia]|nr:hypothetical protein L1887_58196 [Cichorium endivia]